MRILYICNEYPPAIHGGIGIFVRTLAEQLAAMGHDIAVIGYASHAGQRTETRENGVCVVRLPWPHKGRALRPGPFRIDSSAVGARKNLSREAARLAREFRPEVIESHDWSGPLWRPPLRPLVVRLHGASSVHKALGSGRAPRLMRFFERRNVRMADEVVSASRFIGRKTMDVLGLPAKPFTTLHHGVDTNRFRPGVFERSAQEVLFVGTVKRQKGIQELFQGIPRILQAAPQATFTIAGRYPEDPADTCSPGSLMQSLLPPGSNDGPAFSASARVRFLGQVPREELPLLYRRAAVAVFPSYGEAFGLACVEAMSCGAAVVSTKGGSGSEIVEAGKSGLLVEPGDSRALASAIIRLLNDAALRSRLGSAARSRVVETFDLQDAAIRNRDFYEQVVRRIPRRKSTYV